MMPSSGELLDIWASVKATSAVPNRYATGLLRSLPNSSSFNNCRASSPSSVEGNHATAEVLVTEFTRRKNGGKMMMVCAKYDDEYKRTPVGWKFAKRTFLAKTLTVLSELPFSEA